MRTRRTHGVTLVELCVALMVAAVLAGLAAPAFRSAWRTAAVRATAYALMSDLQQTRGNAILRGQPAVLCLATAAGCGGSPGSGWRAFQGTAGAPFAEHLLAEGLELRGSRPRLVFGANALAADAATLTICDLHRIAAPRAIVVSRSGRPRFAEPPARECGA